MKRPDVAKKIVCVGDISPDVVIPYGKTLEAVRELQAGGRCPVFPPELRMGGSIGSTVAGIGRLGMSPQMVCVLSEDEYGDYILDELHQRGVLTDYVARSSIHMAIMIAVLGEDAERAIFVYKGPNSAILDPEKGQLPLELIPETGWVHINGFSNEDTVDYIEKCHEAGVMVSFDLNLRVEQHGLGDVRRRKIERAVAASDVIFGSGIEEFMPLTGISDYRASARALATPERLVIARDRANPIMVFDGDEEYDVPIKKVKPVNTMNSGDMFNSGFITASMKGLSVREAIAWGAVCAANAIMSEKPQDIPDAETVSTRAKELLKWQGEQR